MDVRFVVIDIDFLARGRAAGLIRFSFVLHTLLFGKSKSEIPFHSSLKARSRSHSISEVASVVALESRRHLSIVVFVRKKKTQSFVVFRCIN